MGDMAAPEQVMLDVNAMAAGLDFFQLGSWEVIEVNNQPKVQKNGSCSSS